MKHTLSALFMILALQGGAQNAIVQQHSTAQGFGAYALAGILIVNSDDFEANSESGANMGLGVSYGFTELIEAFAQFQYAPGVKNKIEGGQNYTFTNFEFGARFHFGSTLKAVRPYLDVSYVVTALNLPFDVYDNFGQFIASTDYNLNGGSIGFGAGIDYHISIPFSLKAELRLNPGTFTNEELVDFFEGEVDYDVTTFRINVGAAYRF